MRAQFLIDDAGCVLTLSEAPAATPSRIEFPLGIAALTRHTLRHEPPTPIEAENAIAVVEDAIMPFTRHIPPGLQVHSASDAVKRVAAAAMVAATPPDRDENAAAQPVGLSVDAIEALFSRWSRRVNGSPATREGVPDDAAFAAALIVLRECMHHLRWSFVIVAPNGRSAPYRLCTGHSERI